MCTHSHAIMYVQRFTQTDMHRNTPAIIITHPALITLVFKTEGDKTGKIS